MAKQTWVLRTDAVKDNCIAAIHEATATGKLFRVTLQAYRKPKTIPQNNTLHMWIGEAADTTGHTLDEMKKLVKDMFYPKEERLIAGQVVWWPKSTTELTVDECSMVMERMLAEWAEYVDFTIPDPEHGREPPWLPPDEAMPEIPP